MSRFPQKGLCYSFEILQGLQKYEDFNEKKASGTPPSPPKFFAWAPNSQKYEDSNEEKNFGDPSTPQINPILTGKWANFKYIPERHIIGFQILALTLK